MSEPTESDDFRVSAEHLPDGAGIFVRQAQAALRACARIMDMSCGSTGPIAEIKAIIREEVEKAHE